MTPLPFEPSPDRLAFEARRYSHCGLWLMLLPSGRIAIANAERQLVAVVERLDEEAVRTLLVLAASAPRVDRSPTTVPSPFDSEAFDDIDLRI